VALNTINYASFVNLSSLSGSMGSQWGVQGIWQKRSFWKEEEEDFGMDNALAG
jgi:hypothetical protein